MAIRKPPLGKMRNTCRLVREQRTREGAGYKKTFEKVADFRAMIEPVSSGNEVEFAGQAEPRDLYRIYMKFNRDITTTHRIHEDYTVDGKTFEKKYDIIKIIDIENRHRWMCVIGEVKGSSS